MPAIEVLGDLRNWWIEDGGRGLPWVVLFMLSPTSNPMLVITDARLSTWRHI